MSDLIGLLGSVSAGVVLGWIVAIFLAIVAIYRWVEKYRKARNTYDETAQLTEQNQKAIEQLKEINAKERQEYQEHFAALERKDDEVLGTLKDIKNSISELRENQDKLADSQRKKDVADLKEKIERLYQDYNQRAKINDGQVFITNNEEEILEDLITSYQELGGDSFVHTKIIPAIAKWEVITEAEFIEKMGGGRSK